ncbi:LuxR C-terminal-related transcriptional regulator [Nocardioidaceae bacterium SCSIO 66511]|nr:LuxR C-terminal-related transcriptional regulator [Nocardioidaceae bacterium SCSIO 66511]
MTATTQTSSTRAGRQLAEPAAVDGPSERLQELVDRLAKAPEIRECGACQQYLASALELILAHLRPVAATPPQRVTLTTRELDVLRLLAGGMTAHQIARRLGISCATVRKHLEHAYAKLDVHDRLTATIRMRELDLLPRPDL